MVVGGINDVVMLLDVESFKFSSRSAADWRYLQRADEVLRIMAATSVVATVAGVLLAFFKHTARR